MSKIIKEGELPVKRVKCDYCGCKFEYDKRDVVKEQEVPTLGSHGIMPLSFYPEVHYVYSVACPYCHTSHPLPVNILDKLKAKNPIKDFEEDAKALAAQYGLEVEEIKLKQA